MTRKRGNATNKRITDLENSVKLLTAQIENEKAALNNAKKHSPKNGETVKGEIYRRSYDFNRDAWYDLVRKFESPKWNEGEKIKYLPIIKKKIEERIIKGRCTREQVDNLIKSLRKKKIKKDILKECINDKISITSKKIVIKIKNVYL